MEFEVSNIKLYYRLKKITSNQKKFVADLIDSLTGKKISLFEFPPTLDKTYLYNTSLYSLAKENSKFIILVKTYDKIIEIFKNFAHISKNSKNNSKQIEIVPYMQRKSLCLNEPALEKSSTLDFDMYCTNITATWVPKISKCQFYIVKDFNSELHRQ
jgi:hypothetical protein